MKAVILCGGRGIRARDVSEVLPKPMLLIGNRPILWHIMKTYAQFGIKEFILCLGYKGWKIKEYFLNYKAMSNDVTVCLGDHQSLTFHDDVAEREWSVTLAETGDDTMTGARLWKVRKYLEDQELFCLTYGDGVADINISKLLEFHSSHKKIGTVTSVRPASRFGEIIIEGGIVEQFAEKPNVSAGWINGGFMIFDAKRLWDYLWPDDNLNFEKESLPGMVRDRQLMSYRHDGFWQCMDTLREYELLNALWQSGKAPWKVWK
ncbi:MAG: glucose-1-phosphate cytidylyltransferase [Ignavibacteriae bacterium]|nr:glucose-1-phosphate cytidylyltransferase [Ignavibacteria bacterium]MBI3365938.1 glucose-1-phosphate cytidylyltransferase [Ignavibacteriota bacterium]